MPEAYRSDITVIGAGIIGICCALRLAEKGLQVALVDRNNPAEGASHGNAGVISSWACVPQSLPGQWKKIPGWIIDPAGPIALRWSYAPRMFNWLLRFLDSAQLNRVNDIADALLLVNRDSFLLYQQMLEDTGSEDLVTESHYIHVFRNSAAADPRLLQWALRRERGVPMDFIDGDELREIEPALSNEYKAAVVIQNQGRALNPGRLGQALAEKAQSLGVSFVRAEIKDLQLIKPDHWLINHKAGVIPARKVILAAGAWSAQLLRPLGCEIPLEAERGYHVVFSEPGAQLNNSILDNEGHFAASSMDMGLRCAGIAEFAGLVALPDYRRAQMLARLAKRMLPNLNTDSMSEWMGSRPATPDSLPCIGRVPGQDGLFGAFGHGHGGLTGAPTTGQWVADLVNNEMSDSELFSYRLDRF
ncbi:MAG: FAD-dependent oxidoreductase [Arenicellales bacterium]|nr:FAD-dependent oxidoreductase [Arenicellales bacterium]